MVNKKNLALVQKLLDNLSKNQNFALVKIDKSSHQTLESLRKELKKSQSFFKVIKNTLFEKAINKLSQKEKIFSRLNDSFFPLKETSALLILDKEWSKSLSTFYQFIKKETSLSFKFGLIDGKSYSASELLEIARLPSKDQLLANIIGSMNSSSSRTVFALKFNLLKLTNILKEKSKKSN
ncbi:50S ribosomal protein L10 [Candidatus Roizmanbacteria bacterium]|nr:50S ribosomal protein L10 [Candidatus Roizmanbacteria bacterium]